MTDERRSLADLRQKPHNVMPLAEAVTLLREWLDGTDWDAAPSDEEGERANATDVVLTALDAALVRLCEGQECCHGRIGRHLAAFDAPDAARASDSGAAGVTQTDCDDGTCGMCRTCSGRAPSVGGGE